MTIINSGPLTASANVVRLSDGNTIAGSAALTINGGGTVTLDNTTVNSGSRINASAPIALAGGTLNLLGNATVATSQTLGALTLSGGNSTVNVTNNGQNTAFTFGSLTRTAGATVNFTTSGGGGALNTTTNQIAFTSLPSVTNGIIKGATTTDTTSFAGNTTGFNLATLSGSSVVAYQAYTVGLPTSASVATTNYIANGSVAISPAESVNSLLIIGTGFTISGAPSRSGPASWPAPAARTRFRLRLPLRLRKGSSPPTTGC